jgi:hypothetical protein
MPWARRTAPAPSRNPDPVSPELLSWANALDVTSLSAETVSEAERFLQGYRRMTLPARRAIAFRLRAAIEDQVSPMPPATVGSMDIIATAVSARRRQLG